MKGSSQFPVLPLPYKITLEKEIDTGDKTVSELIFTRYPTGEDIEDWDMQKMTPKEYLKVAGKILNIAPPFLKKLDARDVGEIINFLFPFVT